MAVVVQRQEFPPQVNLNQGGKYAQFGINEGYSMAETGDGGYGIGLAVNGKWVAAVDAYVGTGTGG